MRIARHRTVAGKSPLEGVELLPCALGCGETGVALDIMVPAGWSHADRSVTASERFTLFVLVKFGLRRMPTVAREFSPFSPSGYGQRTSSADRARHGEGRAEHQELSPQGPAAATCSSTA